MKPLDPRLVRYARAVRPYLGVGALLGVVQTASTVAFAFFVSHAVVAAVHSDGGALPGYLGALALTIVVRGALGWALEALSARTAVRVKSELRRRVLATVVERGHAWVARQNSARLSTLIGPGLDALDDYFAKYLPQLILTALATPLLVVVLFTQDVLSGVIVVITLPLIPVFMILIGWTTRSAQAEQWNRLAGLASSFLDAVNGLSTLKTFGRERRQIRRIRVITDEYRSSTMKVLQVSFLSGFALEMAASLSVALVAVAIGVRLVAGSLDLEVGLFLLLLTPEAYLPLRQVGANYHAAAEGVAAAEEVFDVLEDGAQGAGDSGGAGDVGGAVPTFVERSAPPVDRMADVLEIRGVSVAYDGLRALASIDLDVTVGRVTAITGPSGSGKSSLIAAVLGTVAHEGSIGWRSDGRAPTRAEIAWSGQTPGLSRGSVADNIALGEESVDLDLVVDCLATAGGRGIDPGAVLGAGGLGLSGGQAQRVALARALYRLRSRSTPLLLVDEPTSALDSETERELVAGLRSIADAGVAVVVVTHRPGVRGAADSVVVVDAVAAAGTRAAVVS